MKHHNYIKELWNLLAKADGGIVGQLHIIDCGYEYWDEGICVHHRDGYGFWIGYEFIENEEELWQANHPDYDSSESTLYHFVGLDNFVHISPSEMITVVKKEFA